MHQWRWELPINRRRGDFDARVWAWGSFEKGEASRVPGDGDHVRVGERQWLL